MKKNFLLLIATSCFFISHSQTVFWTEAFSNSCASACLVTAYTAGPNGSWTQTSTGTNDPQSNKWYVSGSECGNAIGVCGSSCAGTDPSLHIGANDGITPTDPGASYNGGGICPSFACVAANMRAESPAINCSGKSNITLAFNYIENGDGANDDASLWYFDGVTWSQIDTLPKSTNTGCVSGKGKWTAFSIALPASANNNPNVKIGFNWKNNDDGVGNDPSFAVDDITVSSLNTGVGNYSVENFSFETYFISSENKLEIVTNREFSVTGVFDLLGNKIPVSRSGNNLHFTRNLSSQVYFLEVHFDFGTVTKKFIAVSFE